ncbi:MAG: 3-dehydroquinate synthase [Planctomycetota bacterium]|jgi:3-dehydroquinate synthase
MPIRTIHVRLGDASYDVTIEPGLLERLGSLVARVAPSRQVLLAVDERIASRHGLVAGKSLEAAGCAPVAVHLAAAESHKTLTTVQQIYQAMLAGGLERRDPVVALGGGIVGDTAGFAAATYLRGVPLIQVPTTLLAMVDAAIGGKTGVNFDLPDGGLGKNMIGAFWQPKAVFIDPEVLRTLDPRDLRCGLAECVKHALIADAPLLDVLADQAAAIERLEQDRLVALIERCVRIKVAIVERDEREAGRRAWLNLGHTFAHAMESVGDLGLRHGEAVAVGLVGAAHCAADTGRLQPPDLERVTRLLEVLKLPQRLPRPVDVDRLMRAMRFDKKTAGGCIRLVLPSGLGAVEITDDVPSEVVEAAWARLGAASGAGRR